MRRGPARPARRGGRLPLREELPGFGGEGGELGMSEDSGFHFGDGKIKGGVAGAVELLEQGGAQARHDFPVVVEGIEVALRDAAAQMAVDVLQVFRLSAVDVAREIEIVVVLRVGDFRNGHHAGVARVAFIKPDEGVHDFVNVLLTEAVLRPVLLEALGGINHEDTFAGGGIFFVEHDDAGRDAGAVKEIGGQADDGLEVARTE